MSETGPSVQMLWEPTDPDRTLRDRFGFADGAAARDWLRATLDEHFGIRMLACNRIVMSDRNALAWIETSDDTVVAKWCICPDRFSRLAFLAWLTSDLAERGLPVSAAIPALNGQTQIELGPISISLQHNVVGALLNVDDPRSVHRAGAELAKLHDVLATYPAPDSTTGIEAPKQSIRDTVMEWLDAYPSHLPPQGRETLHRSVPQIEPDRPMQLVHGDYRSANVLCDDASIVAVLDFEEARIDHPVVELARAAVLLGTQYHDWGPVSQEVQNTLLAGYESEHPLTATESKWLRALVLWYSMLFVPRGDDPTGWSDALEQHLRATARE